MGPNIGGGGLQPQSPMRSTAHIMTGTHIIANYTGTHIDTTFFDHCGGDNVIVHM